MDIELTFKVRLNQDLFEEAAEVQSYADKIIGSVPNPDYIKGKADSSEFIKGQIENPQSKLDFAINDFLIPKLKGIIAHDLTFKRRQKLSPDDFEAFKSDFDKQFQDPKFCSIEIKKIKG